MTQEADDILQRVFTAISDGGTIGVPTLSPETAKLLARLPTQEMVVTDPAAGGPQHVSVTIAGNPNDLLHAGPYHSVPVLGYDPHNPGFAPPNHPERSVAMADVLLVDVCHP